MGGDTFKTCVTTLATIAVLLAIASGAIAPYSQGIIAGRLVFTAGQIGMTPEGVFESDDPADQAVQALTNIQNILAAAGLDMGDVVKVTVMMTDMDDYDAINQVYDGFFPEPKPARSAFQVGRLPKDEAKVEIEVVALYK